MAQAIAVVGHRHTCMGLRLAKRLVIAKRLLITRMVTFVTELLTLSSNAFTVTGVPFAGADASCESNAASQRSQGNSLDGWH